MKRPLILVIAVLSILSGVAGGGLHAEETLRVPYRDLCRGMKVDFWGDEASIPREMRFAIVSTQPNTALTEVRVTLNTPDTTLDIPVSKEGSFALPVSKALFEQNALLQTNQPRGTAKIEGRPSLDPDEIAVDLDDHLDEGRIPYKKLAELAIRERQIVIGGLAKQAGGTINSPEPEVDSTKGDWLLVLCFTEEDDSADVVIVEDKTLLPVGPLRKRVLGAFRKSPPIEKLEPGMFAVPYSEELLKDNPVIELRPKASWKCVIGHASELQK
jgi:hypothetical protein